MIDRVNSSLTGRRPGGLGMETCSWRSFPNTEQPPRALRTRGQWGPAMRHGWSHFR